MSNILSIELDNQIVKIIEGSMKGEVLSVHNCINIDVPDGVIEDGEICDMNELEKLIKNKLIQHNIKTIKAHLLINSNSVIIRSVLLPFISNKKETMSMIKYELQQLISADLNQYKIVCKQEEVFIQDGIKKAIYIVNLLHKKMYDEYIELFKRLKLRLISFDSSFNSLSKITSKNINNETVSNSSKIAFVKLKYNSIAFSVVKNGTVNFSRISYLNLDEQLEIESVSESLEDSEKYKIFIQDEIREKEDYINLMFDEISKYMSYYNTISKENNIDKIYIYGCCCDNRSVLAALSDELNIKVEIVEEIDGIELINQGLTNDFETNKSFHINEYFNLMLSFYFNNKDINFLTEKNKKHILLFNTGVTLMAVVLIICLIFVYNGLNYFFTNRFMTKEIEMMNDFIQNENNEKLNQYAEGLKTNILKLEKYKKNAVKLNELIADEDLITSNMFDEIKAALPSDTLIRCVIIDKYSMQLICTSSSMSDISLYELNLKNINFLETVHIPYIESQDSSADTAVYLYSAVCRLRGDRDEAE